MNYLAKLSGKKIAVIGLGYIGSRLADFLKGLQEKFDFRLFEITRENLHLIKKEKFDYIFNCAGNTGDFRRQPVKTVESNIQLNTYLLENCQIGESLVCLSSTRIYGFTENEEKIFTETDSVAQDHLSADALYDNAKKLMECFLLNTPRDYRKIIIRLSNVYGDYKLNDLDDSTFLKLMLRCKYENEKLTTRQNIDSTKDYIFVEDALDGILRGGLLSETDDVYNICSGKSYSVKEWAEFLSLSVESISDQPRLYSKVSNEKSREKLGFTVTKDLGNLSLADIIKYE